VLLYPELPGPIADGLLDRLISLSLEEARQESNIRHPLATYAATGGNRADPKALTQLQKAINEIAAQCGYPNQPGTQQKHDFDAASGKLLHKKMYITPSEASKPEVWNFMACVLLPDIVRWRFPGTNDVTGRERFQGKNRALRNTFGRVWWRAQILYQENIEDPYALLDQLGEDELVQIMERPGIAASPLLAQQICFSFLAACRAGIGFSSNSDLLRDAMKRLRRLLPIISFDALEKEVLYQLIDDIFAESLASFYSRQDELRGIA
jgi:hypothetical protein